MARNETYVNAAPEAVWEVLCDPYAYPDWVVGTDRTVEADANWPAPDSAFTVRFPLGLKDITHSRELDPGRRIVLDAGGGPWGAARVDMRLRPEGHGTHVTMIEDPAGLMAPLRYWPPAHLVTKLRNAGALRRLKRLVEARPPAQAAAPSSA